MSNNRPYLLLTRPQPQAGEDAAFFSAHDIACALAPCLIYRDMPFALPPSGAIDGLVLTSARSVHQSAVLADLLEKPVYCVGTATAAAARQAGFLHVHDANGDAGDLLALLEKDVRAGARLLYLRGHDVSVDVAAALTAAGYVCESRIVYAADKVDTFLPEVVDFIRRGQIGAVAFYSTRTARNFCALVKAYGLESCFSDTKALCISAVVVECVRVLAWAEITMAARPTGADMRCLVLDAMV